MSERDQEYRIKGDLEKANPDIKPLEPTPITEGARKRFESWGIPETFITRLREIASSMRYGLAPQKAQRIAEKGGYVNDRAKRGKYVVLPNFFSFDRLDGQCADISIQLLKLFKSTEFIAELNEELRAAGKPIIKPYIVSGLSHTHFIKSGATHVWVGLLPEGSDIRDIVTIDASFQEISNTSENGYLINEDTQISGGLIQYTSPAIGLDAEILYFGSSMDRKLVYGLKFHGRRFTGKIDPVLRVLFADGKSTDINLNGQGTLFRRCPYFTSEQRREIESILTSLGNMKFVFDSEKALGLWAGSKTELILGADGRT